MSTTPQRQLYIILLVVLLGFIGNSIAYPIFAPLFLHPSADSILSSTWNSHWRNIWFGITLMMYPFGQFIGSPILGALSDRYGRKKILVFSMSIITALYLLTALSLSQRLLWLLLVVRLLTGCCEGNISIARAMTVDISELNKQKSLGLINAMSAIGYILGPLIGGFLADKNIIPWFSFSLPFYVAAIVSLFLIFLAAFYLDESLKNVYHSGITLVQQFNIFSRLKRLSQNKTLKILLITSTIASLSYDTFYEFYPAYLTGYWHATPIQIAWYTAVLSATISIGCGWLNHLLSNLISSIKAITFFTPLIVLILIALCFLPSPWIIIILFMVIGLAIAITTTNYTVQVSESAESHIQGEVLGTLWGLRMLFDGTTALIGGSLIIVAYNLPFIVAAMAAFLSWLIYYNYFVKNKKSQITHEKQSS